MPIRQDIERFHLLFCKALLTSQDKTLIVLKGGCNLRFFMGSCRYSEDIDFDVETIAKDTLKRRVEKVLVSQTLRSALAASKLELIGHSAPKQTETVQRWKVALRAGGMEVPSKIEFSRRGIDHRGAAFEGIDPQLLSKLRMTPTFMTHYGEGLAMAQKVEALAGRSEVQARDVFDLAHLFARYPQTPWTTAPETVAKALESLAMVDFDQFRGQVVEFLEDDAQAFYDSASEWKKLQTEVERRLGETLS